MYEKYPFAASAMERVQGQSNSLHCWFTIYGSLVLISKPLRFWRATSLHMSVAKILPCVDYRNHSLIPWMSRAILMPRAMMAFRSLHVVLSKGDWKYRKEWLEHTRSWSNAAGPTSSNANQGRICPRCFAGQENLPWADSRELFNQADDLREAAETRCWTAHIEELLLLLTCGVQTSEQVSIHYRAWGCLMFLSNLRV